MNKKWIGLIAIFLILSYNALASPGGNETLATTMRSNGKIYVVVAVMLTILSGLILYLISIDRKISKIENEN